jgi:hypothetical protein
MSYEKAGAGNAQAARIAPPAELLIEIPVRELGAITPLHFAIQVEAHAAGARHQVHRVDVVHRPQTHGLMHCIVQALVPCSPLHARSPTHRAFRCAYRRRSRRQLRAYFQQPR